MLGSDIAFVDLERNHAAAEVLFVDAALDCRDDPTPPAQVEGLRDQVGIERCPHLMEQRYL